MKIYHIYIYIYIYDKIIIYLIFININLIYNQILIDYNIKFFIIYKSFKDSL
jgi:hypothetical protein